MRYQATYIIDIDAPNERDASIQAKHIEKGLAQDEMSVSLHALIEYHSGEPIFITSESYEY